MIFDIFRFFLGKSFYVLGLSDFNDDHAVVVVGGCEGSAVLGVVNLQVKVK